MARTLPTGRSGQAIALALPCAALAILWSGVLMPLADWHGQRAEQLEQRIALAQRMESLAASLPDLERRAAAVSTSGAGELALLRGDSDAGASAALQEHLQALFMTAGVQLNSVETLPGEEAGAYRRIRLRVSFNASWPVLTALLNSIDASSPAVLVDELQVQPALHRISTAPGLLDVSCAIFAFRPGATRASAP